MLRKKKLERRRTSIYALFKATSFTEVTEDSLLYFLLHFFKLNVFMNISYVLGYFETVSFNMHAHDYTFLS